MWYKKTLKTVYSRSTRAPLTFVFFLHFKVIDSNLWDSYENSRSWLSDHCSAVLCTTTCFEKVFCLLIHKVNFIAKLKSKLALNNHSAAKHLWTSSELILWSETCGNNQSKNNNYFFALHRLGKFKVHVFDKQNCFLKTKNKLFNSSMLRRVWETSKWILITLVLNGKLCILR